MSILEILFLCFPQVAVVIICILALCGFFIGDIAKTLLMLALLGLSPFIIIGLLSVIYSKSVSFIRDKFHIEGKRFAHLCMITEGAAALTLITICVLFPYMLFFALIPNLIYLIISIVFWIKEFYKGLMISSAVYLVVLVLWTLFCNWVFSSIAML